MKIWRANRLDHKELTAITMQSKAYWGYSAEQIEIWSDQLTITETYLDTRSVYKLELEDKTVGYYSYFKEDKETIFLDNLFIQPEHIGKGLGKFLLNDFFERIKDFKTMRIKLESDPNAELFYKKFGFIKTGQQESTIKGRFLPIMELNINNISNV